MTNTHQITPASKRSDVLEANRNRKMASSAHAYVRGNTIKFYEWLESSNAIKIPKGPAIWICGDCHLGNLGPIADAQGNIEIQIRDLDQTVIGNPAHDLVRLGLSLATAARGSDLPGLITVKMIEQLIDGYELAFKPGVNDMTEKTFYPISVQTSMKEANNRTWKNLARERIENIDPKIPLGKKFWPLTKVERTAITKMFEVENICRLATSIQHRNDDAPVKLLDAAYWMKGCSSLGKLRYAVLLDVGDTTSNGKDLCLIDIKEAVKAIAPRYALGKMPANNGKRVLEGARHLSPHLGDRMVTTDLLGKSVFLRELLPQDLKLEIEHLSQQEAMKVANYLAWVVGKAHARQMDDATKKAWLNELKRNRSKALNAPSWLWTSILELIIIHETAYLEHCRKYSIHLTNTLKFIP